MIDFRHEKNMVDGSYVMAYSEVNLDMILGTVKDRGCCGCQDLF
jgi:hypothetical protein